jgi:hypothetical protein
VRPSDAETWGAAVGDAVASERTLATRSRLRVDAIRILEHVVIERH